MPVWQPRELAGNDTIPVTLVVSPRTRRAYQVLATDTSSWVSAYDLRNPAKPKYLGTIEYPGVLTGDGPHLVDEERGRVFLTIRTGGGVSVSPRGFKGIAVLEEKEFRTGNSKAITTFAPPETSVYSFLLLMGMRFEPKSGKLLMLFDNALQQEPESVASATEANLGGRLAYLTPLAQWDADTGQEDWFFPQACPSAQLGGYEDRRREWINNGPWLPPFLSRDGKALNFMCFTGSDNTQFVRMELAENGRPTDQIERFPGPPLVRRMLVDPQRERSHVVVFEGYVVTFDWASRRVVGTIALSPVSHGGLMSMGIDLRSGRLYALVPEGTSGFIGAEELRDPGGLLMVDGRRTPPPQAVAFSELATPTNSGIPRINVLPDGETGRRYVFVRSAKAQGEDPAELFYRIIEDPIPVSQDPPLGELDRTINIDEVQGKTQRVYAGQASGYGWRSLVVGGGPPGLTGPNETLVGHCPAANRELVAASVQSASLSTIVATARAFPAEADGGTRDDLFDLSRCWANPTFLPPPEVLDETGPGWGSRSDLLSGDLEPVEPAECVGDEEADGHDPRFAGAVAHARCSQEEEKLEATAVYPALSVNAITIGRAYSETKLYRDPKLGVVVETRASTEGVAIEGVGTIEAVFSSGYSRANGRKPKAGDPDRTKWEAQLCGVRTAAFTQQGCENPDAALQALNEAGRGIILFHRPQPDPVLLEGSPGGFVAGVQRDAGDAQIAKIENNDAHPALPGLEMSVRRDDGSGTHRTIVQFAGVQAVASYGISLIPEGGPGGDAPGTQVIIPPLPPPPVSPGPIGPPPNGPGPVDDIVRVVKKGFDVFWRASLDALISAGIWSIFAAPVYLVIRRRRLRLAP